MHRKAITALIIAAAILAPAAAAQAASPALGRWNLTVEAGTYTHPAWLSIETDSDKYFGRFLGGAGSVGHIGEVKVDGNKIEFNAHGHKWTGTVEGDTIKGERVAGDGNKSGWTAERSVHTINLTGKWYVKPRGKPIEHPAILELKHEGDTISGKLTDHGKSWEIKKPRYQHGMFGFSVDNDHGATRYSAAVKGDLLDGIVSGTNRNAPFQAYRQRDWGKPIELFNGKDLSNWKPLGNEDKYHWKVIDGIMENTGPGGSANIVSKEKFGNFKIHVEFKVPEGGNSGLYLRGRHEIQISDSFGQPANWHNCGAIYSRVAPHVNAARPAGEWQTYDAIVVGPYVTVVHNGQVIHDHELMEGITGGAIDSKESEPGPIYLQGDHGKVSYRKITVWPVK